MMFLHQPLLAQSLEGSYETLSTTFGGNWHFENSKFQFLSSENDLGSSLLSGGYYFMSSDTLTLVYVPQEDPNPSIIEVGSQVDADQGQCSLEITVVDEDDKPIPGAMVSLIIHKGNRVMTFISKQDGSLQGFTLSAPIADKLRVSMVGRKDVEVSLEPFLGKLSTLHARLVWDKVSAMDTYKTRTFIIQNTNEGWEFRSLTDDRIFRLVKQ